MLQSSRAQDSEEVRRSIEAWSGCVAGALHEDEYRAKLAAAGFTDIEVEITRTYGAAELKELGRAFGIEVDVALGEGNRDALGVERLVDRGVQPVETAAA